MNIPNEVLDEMKKHIQHFCSLGWDEDLRVLSFGCVQCQTSLLQIIDDEDETN